MTSGSQSSKMLSSVLNVGSPKVSWGEGCNWGLARKLVMLIWNDMWQVYIIGGASKSDRNQLFSLMN